MVLELVTEMALSSHDGADSDALTTQKENFLAPLRAY